MKFLNAVSHDLEFILFNDPAAKSKLEIVLCYPGFHAMVIYRAAHQLYNNEFRLFARVLSNFGRFLTGADIHPRAKIGTPIFLDHANGIVIGETSEVGNNVTIFHGVTLGANFKEQGKRHPTIGNGVIISAGVKVLGSFKVGDNSVIGAGSVVLSEVKPNSVVVGVPARVVRRVNDSNG